MDKSRSSMSGYIVAALLGAAVGGIGITVITRAIPKMMSHMMSSMMANMSARMGSEGCKPEEM